MSSVTDYFERMSQKQYETSKWPLLGGGALFLIIASFSLNKDHDLSRASAWIAIGFGMICYGITEILLRQTAWRVPAIIFSLALWLGGAYWMIHTLF